MDRNDMLTKENIETTYNAETKVWRGLEMPRRYGSDYSVGKAVIEAMLKNPNEIGQICYHNGKEYTNKELAALSIAIARQLTKLGVKQHDVIGIIASYSDFLAPLFFGAMLKGVIVSALNVSYDKNGIKHTFGMTKPKLMFCDSDIYDRVREGLHEIDLNIEIYTMKGHIEGKPSIHEFLSNIRTSEALDYPLEPLGEGLTQTAAIICSSGTTGLPKGVTISNEDLLEFRIFEMSSDSRFLCLSTIDWLTGLRFLVCCTLSGLTRVITENAFTPNDLINMIAKYRVTAMHSSPSHMPMLLTSPNIKTADLSCLQKYVYSGSAASSAVLKQLKKYMTNATFYNGYGTSEVRGSVAVGEYSEDTGRVGKIKPNMQVKVLDDDGKKLGPNELGEFFIKTPFKWLGYYENEKATADTMDADGWIATGDLGYIDENGYLYVKDRKKDIFKYNRFQYFPTEIENVIHELDDVSKVCVFGLPDLMAMDMPAAAVVKKVGSSLTEQEVYDHVAQCMVHFKHLKGGVYFLDDLPQGVTGKVLRNEVKKICEKLRNEKNEEKIE